jgi:hypothetical protein
VRRIFRYEVPVSDLVHRLVLEGPVLAVGCHKANVVEFWALATDSAATQYRWFQVFGTGQELPAGAFYCGTAIDPTGLAWHLFELIAS